MPLPRPVRNRFDAETTRSNFTTEDTLLRGRFPTLLPSQFLHFAESNFSRGNISRRITRKKRRRYFHRIGNIILPPATLSAARSYRGSRVSKALEINKFHRGKIQSVRVHLVYGGETVVRRQTLDSNETIHRNVFSGRRTPRCHRMHE